MKENLKDRVKKGIKDNRIFLILLLAFAFMSIAKDAFLTPHNLVSVARQISIIGILASGLLMLMVSGHFDLSIGSNLALAGVISAILNVNGYSIGIIIPIILLLGLTVGLVNGFIVRYLKVSSLIGTISVMFILRGLVLVLTEGKFLIKGLSSDYLWIGQKFFGRVPFQFILLILVAILCYICLQKSIFGKHLHIIGTNEKSAFLSGIDVNLTVIAAYIITGVLAALAGVIYTSYYTAASPLAGTGMEITVIAAIIVGGANLFGGKGTVLRTIAGVLLLQLIFNGLNLYNVDPNYSFIVQGLIIIAAVAADILGNKGRY